MEPLPKRPRLSLFRKSPSSKECSDARLRNDMTLKSRFESIFVKYAQDFTGIGDEVDIITGEVLVNNGHLESIETETDPGLDHVAGGLTSTGRSILRAMTVTLNPDLPGPNDVLMSIETIAENAIIADDTSTIDSEDNSIEMPDIANNLTSTDFDSEAGDDWPDVKINPYDSGSDSLFEESNVKSKSPDSLFGEAAEFGHVDVVDTPVVSEPLLLINKSLQNENDIITRFGPDVGKELMHFIDQRQQAHIEPAWRIPVKLDKISVPQYDPEVKSSPSLPATSDEESSDSRRNRSLWTLPRQRGKRGSETSSPMRKVRDESLDPLQEDFHSESENMDNTAANGSISDSNSNFEPDDECDQEVLVQAATTGNCLYCNANFGTRSGVMAHWDRVLRRRHKAPKDNRHDFDVMKRIRATAMVRVRLPRLVVYDFRTMVELHEGASMSFDEIASSKTLRTRKSGLRLQAIYNAHRTLPSWNDPPENVRPWTEIEDKSLQEMCQNPLATMSTLRRGLKGRNELEIGNHLAWMWLSQLGAIKGQQPRQVARAGHGSYSTLPLANQPVGEVLLVQSDKNSEVRNIKQEEGSEDDLFDQT